MKPTHKGFDGWLQSYPDSRSLSLARWANATNASFNLNTSTGKFALTSVSTAVTARTASLVGLAVLVDLAECLSVWRKDDRENGNVQAAQNKPAHQSRRAMAVGRRPSVYKDRAWGTPVKQT